MVCRACGRESVGDFSFCPHCGDQQAGKMVCGACGKESADEFSFCPHCGKAFVAGPPVIELPGPPQDVKPVTAFATVESRLTGNVANERSNKIGTYVFGAFAVLSFVASIVKGIVPLTLFESAVWAAAAWYWHKKKTHSDLAKVIVFILAAFVVIGEFTLIARQFRSDSRKVAVAAEIYPYGQVAGQYPSAYQSTEPASSGALSSPDPGEIEQEAVAFYKQKRYTDARPLFDQACNGGEMKACNYLGYFYAQGLGGAHDIQKARNLYQRACEQGTLSSCASLGSLYQDAGDNDNARRFFQKACNGGINEACDLLRNVK